MIIGKIIYYVVGIIISTYRIYKIEIGEDTIKPNNIWSELALAVCITTLWLPLGILELISDLYEKGKQ